MSVATASIVLMIKIIKTKNLEKFNSFISLTSVCFYNLIITPVERKNQPTVTKAHSTTLAHHSTDKKSCSL